MRAWIGLMAAVAMLASAAPGTAGAADAVQGKAIYDKRCKACHNFDAGPGRLGPTLAGLFGRKAGAVAGFRYSAALVDSGIVWDAATLDSYLESPKTVVKGTTMAFPGLKLAEERADVISYLEDAAK